MKSSEDQWSLKKRRSVSWRRVTAFRLDEMSFEARMEITVCICVREWVSEWVAFLDGQTYYISGWVYLENTKTLNKPAIRLARLDVFCQIDILVIVCMDIRSYLRCMMTYEWEWSLLTPLMDIMRWGSYSCVLNNETILHQLSWSYNLTTGSKGPFFGFFFSK